MYLYTAFLLFCLCGRAPDDDNHDNDGEAGQATAEYALVLLGAAAIAIAIISWAARTHVIGHLLDAVFGNLLGKAK